MTKTYDTAYFIERAIKKHGNTYDYAKSKYVKAHEKLIIICKKHGEFLQEPHSHYKGAGCPNCGREGSRKRGRSTSGNLGRAPLSLDEFLRRSKLAHGDFYGYDLVVYKNSRTKVDIVCPYHGIFSQLPPSHTDGRGCYKCSRAQNVHSRSSYIKTCKKHGGLSSLYIIKCSSSRESFFKIGMTVMCLKRRFAGSLMPYDFEVIKIIRYEAGFVWDMERVIHRLMKDFRYKPRVSFAGETECFSIVPNKIIKMLNEISSSQQIQLLT